MACYVFLHFTIISTETCDTVKASAIVLFTRIPLSLTVFHCDLVYSFLHLLFGALKNRTKPFLLPASTLLNIKWEVRLDASVIRFLTSPHLTHFND